MCEQSERLEFGDCVEQQARNHRGTRAYPDRQAIAADQRLQVCAHGTQCADHPGIGPDLAGYARHLHEHGYSEEQQDHAGQDRNLANLPGLLCPGSLKLVIHRHKAPCSDLVQLVTNKSLLILCQFPGAEDFRVRRIGQFQAQGLCAPVCQDHGNPVQVNSVEMGCAAQDRSHFGFSTDGIHGLVPVFPFAADLVGHRRFVHFSP